MPVCFISFSRYGPNVPASLSPATYSSAGSFAEGTVFGFGASSGVVVDDDDVVAAVIGVLRSLTINAVLAVGGAADVGLLSPAKTSVTTVYSKNSTATTATAAATRR